MGYAAKIVADSIGPNAIRLTTMEVTFPRIVLAEFNTHRMFSRNSASSRAIPVDKMIRRVIDDPFIPAKWPQNQKGMQATEYLTGDDALMAERAWLLARNSATEHASRLLELGVHKQIANRLLEPFLWHTVIVTATEWSNFFALRCHPDAQPEIQAVAYMMQELYSTEEPTQLQPGDWHLPYIREEERDSEEFDLRLVSVGRCARVSYLTHDGVRDPAQDVGLCERLRSSGHWSPFEHVAMCRNAGDLSQSGNFKGWDQFRKGMVGECR